MSGPDPESTAGSWRSGPFGWLADRSLARVLWISGSVTVVLFAVLLLIDSRLAASGGPGIIGLEVAGSAARAAVILAEWGEGGRDWARASLILDFPFLIAYAVFLGSACTAMSRRLRRFPEAAADAGRRSRAAQVLRERLAVYGPVIGWAFVAAAVFDLAENFALLQVLGNSLTWTGFAQTAAAIKFGIFGAGLFYLLVSALLTAGRARRSLVAK